MDKSILLARLLGPFITIIAVAVVFNTKIFRKIIEDFSVLSNKSSLTI